MAEPFFGITDTGLQRTNNEDAFIAGPVMNGGFVAACVIDGVGGYEGGEVAAALARQAILDYLSIPSGEPEKVLREALLAANQKIVQEKRSDERLSSMACVATLAIVEKGKNRFYYAHVGDTRLYLFRDGSLVKLSKDHSFVGFLEDSGRLNEKEAMQHPNRNEINRALGFTETINDPKDYIETGSSPFLPGDQLLLCSDGLTDMVNREGMQSILASASSLKAAGQQLVAAANAAGGKDNITVVLVANTRKERARKKPVLVKKDPAAQAQHPLPEAPLAGTRLLMNEAAGEKQQGGKAGWWAGIAVFVVLAAGLVFLLFRGGAKTPVPRPGAVAETAALLQDTITGFAGDSLYLSRQRFGDSIGLRDTLYIANDLLQLKGDTGFVLGGSGGSEAVLRIAPNVSYVLLSGLTLRNLQIRIDSINLAALHFRDVRLHNSGIRVATTPMDWNDTVVTGSAASLVALKKKNQQKPGK